MIKIGVQKRQRYFFDWRWKESRKSVWIEFNLKFQLSRVRRYLCLMSSYLVGSKSSSVKEHFQGLQKNCGLIAMRSLRLFAFVCSRKQTNGHKKKNRSGQFLTAAYRNESRPLNKLPPKIQYKYLRCCKLRLFQLECWHLSADLLPLRYCCRLHPQFGNHQHSCRS